MPNQRIHREIKFRAWIKAEKELKCPLTGNFVIRKIKIAVHVLQKKMNFKKDNRWRMENENKN